MRTSWTNRARRGLCLGVLALTLVACGSAHQPTGSGAAAASQTGPSGTAESSTAPSSPAPSATTPAPSASATAAAPSPTPPSDVTDPNAAGRELAAQTRTTTPTTAAGPDSGAAGGGVAASCANQTLAEAMGMAVDFGQSIVLATGGFTGTTTIAEGEIGATYSEVALTVEEQLAGSDLPETLTVWVFGDLGGTSATAVTPEGLSLWAAGGRMIAIVDAGTQQAGLPGPLVRVAPVVGDDVILSYVGCWPTQAPGVRPFDGAVQIFDDRGVHPTSVEMWALPLDDFRAILPQ